MLEARIKPTYHRYFLGTLPALLTAKKISPNTITMIALISGVAIFPALYTNQPIAATILLLFSGYLDTLDGALARASQQQSSIGTIYDIMSDRLVECSIVLGLCSIDASHRGMVSLCMLASMLICITSFLVAGIFSDNQSEKSFYYSPGLMERAEAFIFFIAMIWLPAYFTTLGILFSMLVLFTGINRIMELKKYL
jgi:archaetidylinositol phosphate synthase